MESGFSILRNRISHTLKRGWKRLRQIKADREILVFSIFLIVAVVFWFSQSIKDNTTLTLDFALELKNVPKSIIFTSDVPKSVSVSVTGKGFSILQYVSKHKDKVIEIDYSELPKAGGVVTIDNYVWKKAFQKELPKGLTYTSISPSPVEIYYSMGDHKQVPVVFKGKIRTESQHQLCGINIEPQYVDVYAPYSQYDTITAVMTEPVVYSDVEDTISFRVALQHMKGVKMVPDSVDVRACVDLYTSKVLKVPIYCENIPDNKILRTFPLMADVSFKVSATLFSNITPDDFIVVVDFNSIKPDDRKCRLLVRDVPEGVSNVKVSPEMVDYVIEQE
ncbi:MAG: hypothetical protein MJY95_03045 [Bacteroidaceae bacterium]|nr:hypothetical protein [Bacteroidaceae bacterium]